MIFRVTVVSPHYKEQLESQIKLEAVYFKNKYNSYKASLHHMWHHHQLTEGSRVNLVIIRKSCLYWVKKMIIHHIIIHIKNIQAHNKVKLEDNLKEI